MELEFDYVVVGAGSAGCVLAGRLTEDRETTVLLLESGGPDRDPRIRIPAAFSKLYGTRADWAFHTVPQVALGGRRLYQPRGRVLGGSSSINAMIYIRGHPDDYDGWEEAGCRGWSYSSVLPYFRRSEDQRHFTSDPAHGTGGPLTVCDLPSPHELSLRFLEAGAALGYLRTSDFNGGEPEGFGLYQVTQRGGRRWSAARAFLRPALGRRNLEVWTGADARRILFDGTRATAVEVLRGGEVSRVRARREVILAAGAFASPQLLMLSGIGPAGHLRAHGIEVRIDRPAVGDNLQDHLVVGIARRTSLRNTLDSAESLRRLAWNLLAYAVFRRGILTSNIAEAGGFVRSAPDLRAPDVQFHFGPGFFIDHGRVRVPGAAGFSVGGLVLDPKSRGTVRLAAPDPREPPRIDPAYLTDPEGEDLRRTVWAFRLAQRLGTSAPFADVDRGPYLPDRLLEAEEEIVEHVRAHAETLYHPVGTCRMGSDDRAVVDPVLRVRGTECLRVVDASVMPSITRGNTNAPVLMIAERAADLIRGRIAGSAP